MPRGSAGSLPVNASSPVGVFPRTAAAVPEGVLVGADGVAAGGVAADVGVAVGVGVAVAAGRTVIVTVCTSAGGVPFDAVIVTVDVAGVVGVPEMTPLVLSIVRPAGSPVAV